MAGPVATEAPAAAPPAPASAPPEARTAPVPATAAPDTPDWRASLPELLRKEKSLETFRDVGALAQAFVETKKMQGRSVQIPGPEATPEQQAAFREKLGVPKTPSDYAFDVPEDLALDPQALETFRGVFHRHGITAEQGKALVSAYADWQQHQLDQAKQGYRQGAEALKREWGDATFARRVTLASRVIQARGSPGLVEVLETTGLGDHPDFIKFVAQFGETAAEDGLIDGRTDGPSKSEALERIREIRADRRHPANNPADPQHKPAHEALLELYRTAYPPSMEGA
ncbi:MAG TPA: hypothetical protein VGF29_06920 [Hyphomicrobiaceae bacterium]|jgi:hypothetical protein